MFKELFEGNENRHLTGTPDGKRDDGKQKLKYKTVKGLNNQHFVKHLAGEVSLGISPLRNGKVRWGALDIDVYPIPDSDVLKAIFAWKEPVLASWTKSRGLHLYVFVDEWVPASLMRKYIAALRKRLVKKLRDGASEIFPKQDNGDGNQINLPAFGNEREPAGAIFRGGSTVGYSQTDPVDWAVLKSNCYVTRIEMENTIQSRAVDRPTSYRIPDNADGRRMFLWKCACSMQARGWPDADIEQEIRDLNTRMVDAGHELFINGSIDEKRISDLLAEVKKLEKGAPADLNYDVVARFNQTWAIVMVNGRVEFLHRPSGVNYPLRDFTLRTAPETVQIKSKRAPLAPIWIRDVDRLEYDGICIESPCYDGPAFNVFQGWACNAETGDASLWEDYIQRLICSNDADLAHWLMSFLADGVQRPWSIHPGSAVAMRGGAGGGKTFLGNALRRLIGPAHAQEINQSDRMFAQFNRGLFGSTFVLAEESLFAGSKLQAATAKSFITSDIWTYEQKYLASFSAKNVHRVIATTNEDQAVHIDHDDRRWTVIEVPTLFENAHGPEANTFWEPYYQLVRQRPGVILKYLSDYKVDAGLIRYGYVTQVKQDDKIASDPLLQVLHEIAMNGICTDDLRGNGKLSAATLAREVWTRGGNRMDSPQRFTNQVRNKFGATSAKNCIHIERLHTSTTADGLLSVSPIQRKDRGGVQMPSLADFRSRMATITGREYPQSGEWAVYHVSSPGNSDPNGGDPEVVEQYARENGMWEKDVPVF